MPSERDWAEAAGALRSSARPGDAVQIWPAWAERARMFVDAAPLLAEEDLAQADYVGVQRLWLLSLPRAPYARNRNAPNRCSSETGVAPRLTRSSGAKNGVRCRDSIHNRCTWK